MVLRAEGTNPEEAQAALEQPCRDCWYPLYVYVRRKGHSPEDAWDLTPDFFAKLLGNDFAQGLTPEGGRFRALLKPAVLARNLSASLGVGGDERGEARIL